MPASGNLQIIQLPLAAPLAGAEAVPVQQNGLTVQTTVAQIAQPALSPAMLTLDDVSGAYPNSRQLQLGTGLSGLDAAPTYTLFLTDSLSGFASVTGVGIVVHTTETSGFATRTIQGTAGEITVSGGSGISGNPEISLPSMLILAGKTVSGGTFDTPTVSGGTFIGPIISGGTISGASLVRPTIDTPTVSGGTFLAPQITNPSASGGTISGVTLTNPAINNPTISGGTHVGVTTLGLRSSAAPFDMRLATDSNLTADRTVIIRPGDANRTLTLSGSLSLSGNLAVAIVGDATLTLSGGSSSVSGTNTGDQTITLSGDVSGTGSGLINTTVLTATTASAGKSRLYSVAVISSTTSAWPVPAGTTELVIEGWGGGGSGGASNTASFQRASGAGGAGYFFKKYTGTMDSTLNITIGAGGTAVMSVSGGANGNSGGNTTVVGANLGTLTANGGSPGQNGIASGGQGGTATNGDQNLTGQDGQTSWSSATLFAAFAGGDSPRGGRGGRSNVGVAGNVPGGGGSCSNHTTSALSGSGGAGQVVIWSR